MFRRHVVVMVSLVTLGVAPLASPIGDERPGAERGRHARNHRSRRVPPVQALLIRRVPEIQWDETTFGEVLSWLREMGDVGGGVNVVPRWRTLASEGVTKDTPVSLQLRDVTVGQVLAEVLDSLSSVNPLTYVGEGNILRITTRSQLRGKLYTRVYDVREIIAQMQASRVQPQLAVGTEVAIVVAFGVPGAGVGVRTESIQTGSSLNGGTFRRPFQNVNRDRDNDDDDESAEEFAQQVIATITATVAPDTWFVNGGRGTIEILDGILIIHNSADVHMQLAGPHRADR